MDLEASEQDASSGASASAGSLSAAAGPLSDAAISTAPSRGLKAISADRNSLPSFLMVARDLTKSIKQTAHRGIECAERLSDLGAHQ